MKSVQSLVILIIYSFFVTSSEGNTFDQSLLSSKTFTTLDIRDTNRKSGCKVVEGLLDQIPARLFLPISRLINHVVDKNQVIWISNENNEMAVGVTVYLSDGTPNIVQIAVLKGTSLENLFFKQKGGKWVKSLKRYADKLNGLELDITFKSAFVLDIRHRDPNYLYRALNLTVYGEKGVVFIPNPGYRVTELKDNGVPIWNTSGSYRAVYILALSGERPDSSITSQEALGKNNYCRLRHLYIVTRNNAGQMEHIALSKRGGIWFQSTFPEILQTAINRKNRYSEHFKSVDEEEIPVTVTPNRKDYTDVDESQKTNLRSFRKRGTRVGVVLDLADDYNPGIKRLENSSYEMSYVMYVPTGKKYIIEVMDGEKVLWKAKQRERCRRVHVFLNPDMHMVGLDVENNGEIENVYFSKVNGVWEE
ncbi:signal peptide containing protein [Theileria equi strain WA]|uniref:Signal peptide containing protein n=1 Tax=Theileria equi strain WA TaxID=1537102 RepID=L1LAH9_THEEQ|nr:signal peptide containing protein [Theileria equi strain WA]EKX72316.1 signal peptide containing protein [Theileria equi strain WA]|eukprot:XP_004831768.1 signal peptide containing protein [Theileria equi strain WA]